MIKLDLQFELNSPERRLQYLETYLKNLDQKTLTPEAIEMMANYVLWSVEDPDFTIESKNSPWSKGKDKREVSYEGLLEQEQETGVPFNNYVTDVRMKTTKKKLDREQVLNRLYKREEKITFEQLINDPSPLRNATLWHPMTTAWLDLWFQIDKVEFMVQNWEKEHGKRRADLPIREELHERLKFDLIAHEDSRDLSQLERELIAIQHEWPAYKFLKKKRGLVSLRSQQYDLIDSLQSPLLQRHGAAAYCGEPIKGITAFYPFMDERLLFKDVEERMFDKEFVKLCIRELRYSDEEPSNSIDLRNPEVIRTLLLMEEELAKFVEEGTLTDTEICAALLHYLIYYVEKCNFSEELRFIMTQKMKRMSNKEIAQRVKEKFNLDYKENYISTIFTKRIVEAIVEQVNLHYKMVEYITMGRTVFKECKICGRLLPRNSTYFNKRTSTSDGFFSYCKECKKRRKA